MIYDRLVSREVLALIPSRRGHGIIRRQGPGCKGNGAGTSQSKEPMLNEAMSGKRVVRLKGGDPLSSLQRGRGS